MRAHHIVLTRNLKHSGPLGPEIGILLISVGQGPVDISNAHLYCHLTDPLCDVM